MKKIFLLLVFSAAASCSGGFHPPAFVTIGAAVRLHLENNRLFSVNAGLDSFDYKLQWYPVVWARDLPLNQPTRVKLFDVNYVVAKTKQQEKQQEDYVAMLDECPHKKVALSEGRVTECGHIQCSYHG
jgi:pheophorbide a oxygenase